MSGAWGGHQLEGLEGLGRVGERIAGARDAQHRHLRDRRGDRKGLFRGLLRRQLSLTTPGRDSLAQSYLRLQ